MLGALVSGIGSIVGGAMQSNQNWKQQKAVMQNQLQWKAADAEKAGISKIYAMGAPAVSYSPSNVGVGTGIADASQSIGRAIDATSTAKGRGSNLANEIASTQLEGLKIDNDIKRAELLSRVSTRSQPGTPPAINDASTTPLMDGQGNSAIKLEKKIAPASPHQDNKSFGVSPDVDMYRTKTGYSPEVPTELGEAQESQPLAAAQWFIRNKLLPSLSDAYKTEPFPAPPGHRWKFNPVFGEYTLVKDWQKGWQEYLEKKLLKGK